MTKRTLLIAPDPRLTKPSKPVSEIDEDIQKLIDDLRETMYAAKGIGLAAPQINVHKRVIVIDHEGQGLPLINPEILWTSEEQFRSQEGCLSFPDIYLDITRPNAVHVTYKDPYNTQQEIKVPGVLAACLQHEIDHLNGILFVDYVSVLRQNMILRKLQRKKRKR